jgi:predicted transposase YbfD/YdcC
VDSASLSRILSRSALGFSRRASGRGPGRRPSGAPLDVISLDDKSVRGSVQPGEEKTKVHIVNAVYERVTLGCDRVRQKSNEITAYPVVIAQLEKSDLVRGKVITIDAMGCQRSIASQIHGLGGYWLFSLKVSQQGLNEEAGAVFDIGLARHRGDFVLSECESPPDKANGRITSRQCAVVDLDSPQAREWLPRSRNWEGVRSLARVVGDDEMASGKESPSREGNRTRYYISSLWLPAKETLEIIVKHWTVETTHNMLDNVRTFSEDHCKIYPQRRRRRRGLLHDAEAGPQFPGPCFKAAPE